MAKNNKIDVNILAERLHKNFGTKMPSNDNSTEQRSEDQLIYTQMIMGSLASMVWGFKNVKDAAKIKSLLGKTNIYDLIDDIKSDMDSISSAISDFTGDNGIAAKFLKKYDETLRKINTSVQQTENLYQIIDELIKSPKNYNLSDDSVEKLKNAIESSEQQINIGFNVNGSEQLNKLITTLSSFSNDDTKKITKTLNSLLSLVNILSSDKLAKDINDKANKNIKTITDLINDNKKGLHAIFKGLEEAINNVTINADLESLSTIIDTLIKIITIDKKIINDKGIKELVKLTNKDGLIDILIDQLITVANKSQINEKNIIALGSFFESIAKVGDIGLIKRYKIKSNLKYFSKFITKDIPAIFEELVKVSADSESEDKLKAMAALGDFFLGIIKIAEIDNEKRKQLRSNLEYIKKYILGHLVGNNGIINQIILAINEASKEFNESIKTLNDFFDKLLKIGEFSFKDLIVLELKLSYLSNIFKEQVTGGNGQFNDALIPTIIHIQDLEFIKERIDLLEDTFDLVEHMFDDLPSLKKLLLIYPKLKLISLNITSLDSIINSIKTIEVDDELINKLQKLVKVINSINKLALSSITAKVSSIGFDALIKTTSKLKAVIDIYHDINEEDLEKALETNKQFTKLIVVSAAVLIAGSLLMSQVKIENLITFVASLTVFTLGLAGIYFVISKTLEDNIEVANSFMGLVAFSGAILLLGSMVMKLIDIKDLFAFTISLSVFLLAIGGTYRIMSKDIDDLVETAKAFSNLIMISAGALMIGGLYIKLFGYADTIGFGILLWAFVTLITTTFVVASKFMKKSLSSVKEFSYLIAVSTACLILGGLYMSSVKRVLGAIGFAILLGVFILGIVKIFINAGNKIKFAMAAAIAMTILIGVSTIALMLGGWFMSDGKRALGALEFAVLLGGFIFGITWIFNKYGKDIAKAIPTAIALCLITAISTIALLIGGYFITSNKDLLWGIPVFLALMMAYTYGMIKILGVATKKQKDILIGAGLVAILGGLIFEMSYAFKSLIETSKMIGGVDDWIKLGLTVVLMGAILTGLYALVYGIASDKTGTVTLLMAAGTAIIAGLIYCIVLIGQGIQELAKGMQEIAKVSEMHVNLGNLFNLLLGFASLAPVISGLGVLIAPLALGSIAIKALNSALSDMAFIITSYANLTVPMYDENGQLKGFRQLSDSDITLAIENAKYIVTSLFDAIRQVYEENPDMFAFSASSIFSLFSGGGGTIFGMVAVAGKKLAIMLSMIAESVQQWCDLRIPIYEGTKIVGYKTLDDNSFSLAAENIEKVITCLGSAIIETYYKAKANPKTADMFDNEFGIFGGDTPFEKVCKSFYVMGEMLSSVAEGIKDWSDLKIPIYTGTEITDYQTLNNGDFQTAANNIKKVLVCIGEALIDTVKGNKDIFGDKIFEDGPAIVAAKAMKIMGETLNLTATAVASYASGEFPIFDKDGKIIDTITVDGTKIDAATTKIKDVLTAIGDALIATVTNDNKEIFEDGWISESPAVQAAEAVKGMSEALNNTITAIQKIAELNIDDLKAALDPNGPDDNVYHKLVDVLSFTVSIYQLFAEPDEENKKYGTGFWTGTALSFAEYLDKYNGDIEDANEALETFTTMLSTMLGNYVKIGEIFTQHSEELAIFRGADKSIIYDYVQESLSTIDTLIKEFTSEAKLDLFDEIDDNEKDINNGISAITGICKNLLDNILLNKEIFDKIGDFSLTNLFPAIHAFNACINELTIIGKFEKDGKVFKKLPEINSKDLFEKVKTYSEALNTIIKIAEYAKKTGDEGYNTLRDGILTIEGVTKKVSVSENFKNHTTDLQNYVQTINSIDLRKLLNLQLFVNSLNQLSRRLGNLDNLTDAIANRLSAVLFELVQQLTKADQSINNAHQLQEKRKKLIDESMRKISTLMSQHMIVEITQVDPRENNNPPTERTQNGSVNGEQVTNNEGYQPENSSSFNELMNKNKLTNPENVGNETSVNTNKQSESELAEFKQWMINEYTNELVKKIKE